MSKSLLIVIMVFSGCVVSQPTESELFRWYKLHVAWEKYRETQQKSVTPDNNMKRPKSPYLESVYKYCENNRKAVGCPDASYSVSNDPDRVVTSNDINIGQDYVYYPPKKDPRRIRIVGGNKEENIWIYKEIYAYGHLSWETETVKNPVLRPLTKECKLPEVIRW